MKHLLSVACPMPLMLAVACSSSELGGDPEVGPCGSDPTRGGPVFVDRVPSTTDCIARPLNQRDGRVGDCIVVEATQPSGSGCGCDASLGRVPVSSALDRTLRAQILSAGEIGVECSELCLCEVLELDGAALEACQFDASAEVAGGFCYVAPDSGVGAPELIADCPAAYRQRFRYGGGIPPSEGGRWYVACTGPALISAP